MKLGMIGTGLMGRPMAHRLLDAGHDLCVWNRTTDKTDSLREAGARVAETAAGALTYGEAVVLMLSDAAAVREVMGLPREGLRDGAGPADHPDLNGRVIINMSTIGPGQSRNILLLADASDAEYMEAPVLGSIPQAESGTLVVMAGATGEQFDRWLPVLRCFGTDPVRVGPVGKAAALKLALNQLIGSLTAAFSFSLGLVRREGIDVDLFMRILKGSALHAPTFDKKLDKMLSRDFADANFPAKHLHKDLGLAVERARELGLETRVVEAARAVLADTMARGAGDEDYSALYGSVDPEG